MLPEQRARQIIDRLLAETGWAVQDRARLNLGAARGVAVREFPLTSGPVDYLLFVDRRAVGVVEAKRVGETLTGVETQSAAYREGVPVKVPAARLPLPFAYESTGVETRFTSDLDPEPRSRPVFAFHRPETLASWLAQVGESRNDTLRAKLRDLPPLERTGLRDCQFEAITNLERSLAANRPRALIQMATGSGKTYTAISGAYRLLKHGGARRVLFLVDRATLGQQAFKEFAGFATPDDGRKFTELYIVQHLLANRLDPTANVCIATIQRLYSILSGEPEPDPSLDDLSLFEQEAALAALPPREVRYNPAVPIEWFDAIVIDECHRSIYNQWRRVLEYFDAFLVGLTATPNKQTFGFFRKNLVMEYGHERAVTDGVNVDYQVYRIRTAIGEGGGRIEADFWVDRRDRLTRAKRWERLDEDFAYTAQQLDRDVVAVDQLRTVLRAYRDALATDLFPGRSEVPKTLIFAKDDSHADDIVQQVREVFDRGNEFAQKITYRTTGAKPENLIQDFRNRYYPRVAVTVDMISTGTDIRPLEVLLFLRSVKSQGYFEQMKGRGTRTISDTDLRTVTPGATKTHFVIVDAVGVMERHKTDEPALERKRSVAFKDLLAGLALGAQDDDTLATLAGRLGRLAGRVGPAEERRIQEVSGGRSLRELAAELVAALDPDRRLAAAQEATGQREPDAAALAAAAVRLADAAAAPFDTPDLRDALIDAQRRDEQIIDEISTDRVLSAGRDPRSEEQARRAVRSFRRFMEEHRDEITALEVLYARRGALTLEDVRRLADAVAAPPLGLTTDRLWQAYETLERSRVRGAGRTRLTTDMVALVRYTLDRERDQSAVLEPWSETVRRRFAGWLADQERRRGQPFTDEQRAWLELMRDHVAASLTIEREDFDLDPFSQHGGLGRAHRVFGGELNAILQDLNEGLAA